MAKSTIAKCDVGTLQFLHPGDWTVEVNETEDGPSVSLQSPGASFGIVAAFAVDADPEIVIDQAIESLREEHPGLEIDDEAEDIDPDLANDPQAVVLEAVFFQLGYFVVLLAGKLAIGRRHGFRAHAIDRSRTSRFARRVFGEICRTVKVAESK